MSIAGVYAEIVGWLTDNDVWESFGRSAVRVILFLVVGRFLVWVTHKTIDRVVLEREAKRISAHTRRMTTIGKLMKNVTSYVVYFITVMLILSEFGINLGPLLAGAGCSDLRLVLVHKA